MTKKVKILGALLSIYLGILPLIFYAHATGHKDHNHNISCHAEYLLIQDEDGSPCELCQLFVNQTLFLSSVSFIGELSDYFHMRIGYHFVSSPVIQPLPFLRAPPIFFK